MIHFWLIPRGEVCWDGGVWGNIFFSYKRRVYQVISLPLLLPVFCLWTWSLEETLWGAISILLQPWGDRGRDLELLNQCQPYLWIPCHVRIKNPIGRVFCYLKPKVVLCVINSTGYLQGPVLRHQGNKRPIGYDSHPQGACNPGGRPFPVKGQRVNTSGFGSCTVSVTTTQSCSCGEKAGVDKMEISDFGWVPTELYLWTLTFHRLFKCRKIFFFCFFLNHLKM